MLGSKRALVELTVSMLSLDCMMSVAEMNDFGLPSNPTRFPLVPGPDIWSFLLSRDRPASSLGGWSCFLVARQLSLAVFSEFCSRLEGILTFLKVSLAGRSSVLPGLRPSLKVLRIGRVGFESEGGCGGGTGGGMTGGGPPPVTPLSLV